MRSMDINKIKFDASQPIMPHEQLLAVLPPSCYNMLPKSYQYLMYDPLSPIIDYYPITIKLDMIDKDMWWKCMPHISCIDIARIKGVTSHLKLSNDEAKRNKKKNDYYNIKC